MLENVNLNLVLLFYCWHYLFFSEENELYYLDHFFYTKQKEDVLREKISEQELHKEIYWKMVIKSLSDHVYLKGYL